MDELFFGVKRSKPRRGSPARRRRTPVRRTKRTPVRRTRRTTTMCRKGLSLPKLRKLAMEHGVNIYSEAKTAVSKRTGLPKKPKMVSCATLEKRLKEAGLDHLYRRMPKVNVEMPQMSEELFEETPPVEMPDVVPVPKKGIPPHVMMQADPACHPAFMALAEKQPNNRAQAKFLKEYKGYAMGQGPCDKRDLVPVHMQGSEDDLEDYAEEAGFDMLYGSRYGRRHRGGARPKMTQKHVGEIVVKGRVHQVFRGKEGGLYYMKGKTGSKIYIDKKRLKKSPKRR